MSQELAANESTLENLKDEISGIRRAGRSFKTRMDGVMKLLGNQEYFAAGTGGSPTAFMTPDEAEAGSLPYGYQKVLGLGIALAARPRLAMLDEPAAGLSHDEAVHVADVIRRDPSMTTRLLRLVNSAYDLVIEGESYRKRLKPTRRAAAG